MLITQVLQLFHNHEPSKLKLFEVVRNTCVDQFSALLFLLSNTVCEKDRFPLLLESDERRFQKLQRRQQTRMLKATCVVHTAGLRRVVATLTLERAIVERDIHLFSQQTFNAGNQLSSAAGGERTLLDLLLVLTNSLNMQTGSWDLGLKTDEEKVLVFNLSCPAYKRLVGQVTHYLLPEGDKPRRGLDTGSALFSAPIHQTFLRYTQDLQSHPRHPTRLVKRPDSSWLPLANVTIQPLYRGLFLIVSVDAGTGNVICRNRYGERIPNLLKKLRLKASAIFHAVLLPVDKESNARSWGFWAHRDGEQLVVLDVLQVGDQDLQRHPHNYRLACFPDSDHQQETSCITTTTTKSRRRKLRVTLAPTLAYEQLQSFEEAYFLRQDLFDSIGGVYIRWSAYPASISDAQKYPRQQLTNSGGGEYPYEYRFTLTTYYDFLEDKLCTFSGPVSIPSLHQRVHTCLEMAERRTVCVVYGHSAREFYVCTFDPAIFQFVHVGTIARVPSDWFSDFELVQQEESTMMLEMITSEVNPLEKSTDDGFECVQSKKRKRPSSLPLASSVAQTSSQQQQIWKRIQGVEKGVEENESIEEKTSVVEEEESVEDQRLRQDFGYSYKQQGRLYVVGAQTTVRGIMLLRVYFNKPRGCAESVVVGYETKPTTSVYDVPKKSALFFRDVN